MSKQRTRARLQVAAGVVIALVGLTTAAVIPAGASEMEDTVRAVAPGAGMLGLLLALFGALDHLPNQPAATPWRYRGGALIGVGVGNVIVALLGARESWSWSVLLGAGLAVSGVATHFYDRRRARRAPAAREVRPAEGRSHLRLLVSTTVRRRPVCYFGGIVLPLSLTTTLTLGGMGVTGAAGNVAGRGAV